MKYNNRAFLLRQSRYLRKKKFIKKEGIVRIFDNLTSNIVKYGDRETPVKLKTIYSGQSAGFVVTNGKANRKEKTESTRIGLRNIEKMMEKQGGGSIVEQTGTEFEISLQFPCIRHL